MYNTPAAQWSDTLSNFEKAASFLSDLKVDAGLFSDPSRGEEWLMAAENIHHALMAMERQYADTAPDPVPFWFSNTPLGVECGEFLQLAAGCRISWSGSPRPRSWPSSRT